LSKTSITFAVLLLGAIILSGYLFIENYSLETDLKICREGEKVLIGQRDFLLDLIPELEPEATKLQLVKLIKAKYPSERVDELENLVGWRLFKFWFNKEGKLTLVQYSS
jgi:hypothetical protein